MYVGDALPPVNLMPPPAQPSEERVREAVRAIHSVTSSAPPNSRGYDYERRIVWELMKKGFYGNEIDKALALTRKYLGLPDRPLFSPWPPTGTNLRTIPSIGPGMPRWQQDRAHAEHLHRLALRAQMGDLNAAKDLIDALKELFDHRQRLADIRRELIGLRSPAAILLQVPREPAMPSPDPSVRWRFQQRPVPRR